MTNPPHPPDQSSDAELREKIDKMLLALEEMANSSGRKDLTMHPSRHEQMLDNILDLIHSAREKDVKEAQMKMFNRVFNKTTGVTDPQQGAQLMIRELNIIRAELTNDKEALAQLRKGSK